MTGERIPHQPRRSPDLPVRPTKYLREITYRYRKTDQKALPINSPRDVFDLMQTHTLETRETFWVIALNTKNHPLAIDPVTTGTVNSAMVAAREVFRVAIATNAPAIICVHNHPSGDPNPSPEDKAIARAIASAAKVMDIELLDFVIVGDGYRSLAETGDLPPASPRIG